MIRTPVPGYIIAARAGKGVVHEQRRGDTFVESWIEYVTTMAIWGRSSSSSSSQGRVRLIINSYGGQKSISSIVGSMSAKSRRCGLIGFHSWPELPESYYSFSRRFDDVSWNEARGSVHVFEEKRGESDGDTHASQASIANGIERF